jgi:hypothetical protein
MQARGPFLCLCLTVWLWVGLIVCPVPCTRHGPSVATRECGCPVAASQPCFCLGLQLLLHIQSSLVCTACALACNTLGVQGCGMWSGLELGGGVGVVSGSTALKRSARRQWGTSAQLKLVGQCAVCQAHAQGVTYCVRSTHVCRLFLCGFIQTVGCARTSIQWQVATVCLWGLGANVG